MSDEQTIYISPEDDLTTVRERLEQIPARRLTMVIPPQTQLRSYVAWKLLHARARELSKEVVIVSSDPQVRSVAHAVKFKVAHSLESSPATGKPRPASRSGRTSSSGGARTRTSPPVSSRPSSVKASSESRSGHSRREASSTQPPHTHTPEPEWHEDPQHRQQYDFGIQPPPAIHPLSDQIEEPDLLLEDYTLAPDIRSAAREGQKHFPETDIMPETRPEEALPSSSTTQQPHTADDPCTHTEDPQPPQTEPTGVVSLESLDTNEHIIQDLEEVEDVPDSFIESAIEFRGDRDDIVPPPSSKPITYIEAEQAADDEEQDNFPSRTYGVSSRRRSSSNLSSTPPTPPTPSATPATTTSWARREPTPSAIS